MPFLELLAEHAGQPELVIDFSGLQRVSPAGLAALTAYMARRNRERLTTNVLGLESCPIRDYLQRMNLHRLCGWERLETSLARHDSRGRFVPLAEIPARVDDLAYEIAACIAPGGEDYQSENAGLYDAAYYLISEMANNVRQHSKGVGYVAAQTIKQDGFVKIAIADCGCGIPGSLRDAGFPWAQDIEDADLIEQAMVARISSKGQPSNEGVGLTLSARIVELMGGHMLVSSNSGTVIRSNNAALQKSTFPGRISLPGTLVAMTFLRSQAADFDSKLQIAKDLEIPLRARSTPATFEP